MPLVEFIFLLILAAAIIVGGALFILFGAAGSWRDTWLPALICFITGASLFYFTFANAPVTVVFKF
jgi:hypothetical protein